MPSSATVGNHEELDSFLLEAELGSRQQLSFYGNMDGPSDNPHEDQPLRSNAPNTHPALGGESNRANMASPHFLGPHGAPPQVPPETYDYLIHALLSLQGSASHSYPQNHAGTYPYPTQLGPLPPYNYGWPAGTTQSMPGSRSMYPSDTAILPPNALSQSMAGPSQLSSSSPAAQTVPTTQDPEQMDIADDKRRRNTAASARFRVKKKNKTLDLEHTVADLTGRTEVLQREAAGLRRENAWLKDIVLLKGRNLAGLNLGFQAGAASRHGEDEAGDDGAAESGSESTEKLK